MINALEGREQYQVCGQNCDPPDEDNVTPLFLKVNQSTAPAACKKNGYRPTGRIGCFFGVPLFEYSKSV
jgi:hypothetical protein